MQKGGGEAEQLNETVISYEILVDTKGISIIKSKIKL